MFDMKERLTYKEKQLLLSSLKLKKAEIQSKIDECNKITGGLVLRILMTPEEINSDVIKKNHEAEMKKIDFMIVIFKECNVYREWK